MLENFLKFGAKIYTYGQNAFLHAKTIVIDDSICSIGTANMDIRSFELNFEVNAFMYSSKKHWNKELYLKMIF